MKLTGAILGLSTRRTIAFVKSVPSCYAIATKRKLSDINGKNFKVEFEDDVAIVTMSIAPGNALDLDFFSEFTSVLDDVEKSSRGMIVTSVSHLHDNCNSSTM